MASRLRRSRSLSPIGFARQTGFYRGLVGGNRGWLTAFAVLATARQIRHFFGRNQEVVTLEKLKPGQFVSIRTYPQKTRAQRKAVKRT